MMEEGLNNVMPKVSVLVVTYNQQSTIARTLDSILAQQTDFPFEIEIADDCSTDGTGDICRKYASEHPDCVRYTRNEQNLGVRENYFRALRRCRAEYIADCAGDDYWIDRLKLKKQAEILDNHPKAGLVHTGWEFENEATGKISPSDPTGENAPFLKPLCAPGELVEAVFVNKMLIHWCTALYRKSIFEVAEKTDPYPFVSPEITFEDFQLSVIYAHDTWIAYLPDITMRYTIGSDTVTHTADFDKLTSFVYSLLKLKHHFAERYSISERFMRPIYEDYARFLYATVIASRNKALFNEIDAYFRRHSLPRERKVRLQSTIFRIPVAGRLLSYLKRMHFAYNQKK